MMETKRRNQQLKLSGEDLDSTIPVGLLVSMELSMV